MTFRKKTIISIALFCFSSFLVAEVVYAYEFPPYQGITLKVLGDISGNYSNNVTYTSDKENRIEDFRTMLNLGLDLQYKGKRNNIGFSGRVSREIFEDKDVARNPSENLILSFSNAITKYDRIQLRNNFRHTREPGRFIGGINIDACREYYEDYGYSEEESENICNEFNEEFGRFRGSFDSYSNNLNFSYTREISDTVSVTPSYTYVKNWSTEEGTNDSDRNAFGLRGDYKLNEATRFFLSYNYEDTQYDSGNKLSREAYKAGITKYLTKSLVFRGEAGRTDLSNGENNISGSASLTSLFDEKTSASLSYSQKTEISDNTDSSFENSRLTMSLTKGLLEDLNGSLSVFYGKGEYSPSNVTDTLAGASVNFSYVFWEAKRGSQMSGNLGYSYSDLTSTNGAREYSRNSATFGLRLMI